VAKDLGPFIRGVECPEAGRSDNAHADFDSGDVYQIVKFSQQFKWADSERSATQTDSVMVGRVCLGGRAIIWYEALQFLETGNSLPFGKVLPVLTGPVANGKSR
jgi:hypothetical protein